MQQPQPPGLPRTVSVLVVDDDLFMQTIIVKMLTSFGYTGVIVDGGNKALACLSQRSFDVVLLDLIMPDMDGLETLTLIRSNDSHLRHRQKVIMVTGHDEPGDVQKLIEAGADGCVAKPVQIDRLRAELIRVLQCA